MAGCASEMRCAASFKTSGLRQPGVSIVTRAIVSRATRASRDALLVRSVAIPSIASSTAGPSMLHPPVICRDAPDAHPDPPFQEIPRETLRGAATHLVQLPEDDVFTHGGEPLLHDPGPGGIQGHHRLDSGPRFPVRAVMAEQQSARLEVEQKAERLEVLFQVERRCGRDRHNDLVTRKITAGGVACADAPGTFIQDIE